MQHSITNATFVLNLLVNRVRHSVTWWKGKEIEKLPNFWKHMTQNDCVGEVTATRGNTGRLHNVLMPSGALPELCFSIWHLTSELFPVSLTDYASPTYVTSRNERQRFALWQYVVSLPQRQSLLPQLIVRNRFYFEGGRWNIEQNNLSSLQVKCCLLSKMSQCHCTKG